MIRYEIISAPGNREYNEDYASGKIAEDGKNACFVLCDGLGGHGRGEVASALIVNSVLSQYEKSDKNQNFLAKAFETSHTELLQLQEQEHSKNEMKTTAVILQIMEDQICWGHVGDSRLYCFEKGKLKKRTLDHSVPQMLVVAKEIKEKEIRHHPDRNRLLRVMGMEWDSPKYVLDELAERKTKYAFLLCSDGFWELIEEKAMEKCLKKSKTPQEWLSLMEKIVVKNGKGLDMDNYTAIAVFVERD